MAILRNLEKLVVLAIAALISTGVQAQSSAWNMHVCISETAVGHPQCPDKLFLNFLKRCENRQGFGSLDLNCNFYANTIYNKLLNKLKGGQQTQTKSRESDGFKENDPCWHPRAGYICDEDEEQPQASQRDPVVSGQVRPKNKPIETTETQVSYVEDPGKWNSSGGVHRVIDDFGYINPRLAAFITCGGNHHRLQISNLSVMQKWEFETAASKLRTLKVRRYYRDFVKYTDQITNALVEAATKRAAIQALLRLGYKRPVAEVIYFTVDSSGGDLSLVDKKTYNSMLSMLNENKVTTLNEFINHYRNARACD